MRVIENYCLRASVLIAGCFFPIYLLCDDASYYCHALRSVILRTGASSRSKLGMAVIIFVSFAGVAEVSVN